MKQIYNFEQHNPPILNENMLRTKLEQRKLRWQMALITFASILIQAVLVMLGVSTIKEFPIIAYICTLYVICSTTGGSILAIVYTRKGGLSL